MDPVSPERRRLLPSSSLVNNASKRKYKPFNCFNNYCKELKSRSLSLPSILLLIYALPVEICIVIFDFIFKNFSRNIYNQCGFFYSKNDVLFYNVGIIVGNTLFLLAPVCGWLSDTKIGRGNAIYLGLWLGWIGALIQAIGCCLQYISDQCDTVALMGKYVFSGIALVLMLVSLSLMITNILPYGIDQLMNESSVKIRAFIHWYWLCLYSGYALPIISDELTISIVAFVLFSFCLCLHFLFKHHFEHIPIPNPYKIVFSVLKFSLTTSGTRRQHRSAFTYWGEEPSRMDLAKERYGGCFSHEEVENVKTFLRIAVVFTTVCPLFVSAVPFLYRLSNFTVQFKDGDKESATDAVWVSYNVVLFFILVPLFELVILPLFPKLEYFIINPLKGLGLAYILLILSIVSVFLIDFIGRLVADSDSNVPCFFIWEPVNQTIDISYWILLIPSVLAGISHFLTWIYLFEFICSQSPFGIHGMIFGLFWFLSSIFIDIGLGVAFVVFYYKMNSVSFMSCTSWFTIMFCIITGIGLVVYVLIARWYVNRVRDTDLGLRAAVEEHWENRLMAGNAINDTEASEEPSTS
uniref:Major facilitator superfamily associated domain-containing protein n=1 Tax=Amphimedon queenslandica TaxID=400682 RepID=A0A1X7TVV5_AMPQE